MPAHTYVRECRKRIDLTDRLVVYCILPAGHKGKCMPPERHGTIVDIATYVCLLCNPIEVVFVKDKIQHEREKHGRVYSR
jgi:hypothetical protein